MQESTAKIFGEIRSLIASTPAWKTHIDFPVLWDLLEGVDPQDFTHILLPYLKSLFAEKNYPPIYGSVYVNAGLADIRCQLYDVLVYLCQGGGLRGILKHPIPHLNSACFEDYRSRQGRPIDPLDLTLFVEKHSHLEHLNLSGTGVSGSWILKNQESLLHLKILEVQDNGWSDFDHGQLAQASQLLESLETLIIDPFFRNHPDFPAFHRFWS